MIMPISVVVGGQFGSEGKGKTALFFAEELKASAAVRVGGPNSGHTAVDKTGKTHVFRHLPTAALLDNVFCILPAGSYIVPEILQREINQINLDKKRLLIDPLAMVVSLEDIQSEKRGQLSELIGSTASGMGSAVLRRISRHHSVSLARDDVRFRDYIAPTVPFMRDLLSQNKRIILEGTQGFGLSLLHSQYYPFATSRDTTASAVVSETGLSPLDVDDVILVIRSFPIRVAGNSGPLPKETDWKSVSEFGGSEKELIEYTSVTKRVRRVAHFDSEIVNKAIQCNRPSHIVLNHLDYIDRECFDKSTFSSKVIDFIKECNSLLIQSIDYLGTSPSLLIRNDENQFGDSSNEKKCFSLHSKN
jgi:adenylosuccinate synthase